MDEKRFDTASEASRAEITLLLDFYGNALTERQRRTAELYFQEDLSLGEIAQMTGITRQGVRDGLKKAEKSHALDRALDTKIEAAVYSQLEKQIGEVQA